MHHLFETTVAKRIQEDLGTSQCMAIDASIIEADANKQNFTSTEACDAKDINPTDAPRAVHEYLSTLDEAVFGAASEVQPKVASHSDATKQWTAASTDPAFFGYPDDYLIDTDHRVIVAVKTTGSIWQAKVGTTKTMLKQVKEKFDLHPELITAGVGYNTDPILG